MHPMHPPDGRQGIHVDEEITLSEYHAQEMGDLAAAADKSAKDELELLKQQKATDSHLVYATRWDSYHR